MSHKHQPPCAQVAGETAPPTITGGRIVIVITFVGFLSWLLLRDTDPATAVLLATAAIGVPLTLTAGARLPGVRRVLTAAIATTG